MKIRMLIYSDDRTKQRECGEGSPGNVRASGLTGITLSVQVLTIEVFEVALNCRKRGSTKPFSNGQC